MCTLAEEASQAFDRKKQGTEFHLLSNDTQVFIESKALSLRFTHQDLRQICRIALDRQRWQESSIGSIWPDTNQKTSAITTQKKQVIKYLVEDHAKIQKKQKEYLIDELVTPKTKRPKIELVEQKKIGIGLCPVASTKTRCCNLMTLDAVQQCGFGCSYCSIQSFYYDDKITFDATFKEKLLNLQLDPKKTYHIGTGQSSDSLLWGNKHGVLEALVEFATQNPNVILELKTKSQNVKWLLDHDLPPNMLFTWSLNTQKVIDHEEHLTASIDKRLQAAKKMVDKGCLVGFHFHPIIWYLNWEDDYQKLCERLLLEFPKEHVALVSMGTLTFTKSVMKTIRQRPLYSKILQMPMEKVAGKYTYPMHIKEELFKTVYLGLSKWHKEAFFYLCMEPPELWVPVLGYEYPNNYDFELAMKNHYQWKVAKIQSSL